LDAIIPAFLDTFISDPGLALSIRWVLAFVFILAVVHKIKAPVIFQSILENYRLLPSMLVTPLSYLIIVLEIVTIVALLVNVPQGSALAAGVLFIYTAAITINLIRGRIDIDCGCSGPAIRQTLNGWLVVRNTGLIALAMLTLRTSNLRPLEWLDGLTTAAAVIVFALIYTTVTQLSAVSSRYHH